MSETITDGLRFETMEFESDLASVTISRVTSINNPSMPPAATIEVKDKCKAYTMDRIDLERFEAMKTIRDAIDQYISMS